MRGEHGDDDNSRLPGEHGHALPLRALLAVGGGGRALANLSHACILRVTRRGIIASRRELLSVRMKRLCRLARRPINERVRHLRGGMAVCGMYANVRKY